MNKRTEYLTIATPPAAPLGYGLAFYKPCGENLNSCTGLGDNAIEIPIKE